MGQFRVRLTFYLPEPAGSRTVEALVDTGAAYTVVPRSLLEPWGYRGIRMQRVVLADGRIEEWPLCELVVEYEGRRVTTPVLISPSDGPILLGAITLEALGLGIDPVNRRLVPVDLYLASDHICPSAPATLARSMADGNPLVGHRPFEER